MRGGRLVAAAVVLITGHAWRAVALADESSCADVRVNVQRAPGQGASSKLVETIFAEVSPHASAPCEPEPSRPVASIRVEWTATQSARVRVDLKRKGAHYVVARDVDLSHVARDTVALTIAIAADELLREARDRAVAHEAMAMPPSAPSSAPPMPSPPSRPPPRPERRWALGSALSGEWFSSGVALVGPDATLAWRIRPWLALSTSIGLRAAIADRSTRPPGAIPSAGVWLRLRLMGDGRIGAGVAAGADALALATAGHGVQAMVAPGVELSGWQSLADGCRLRLDAGGALPSTRLQTPAGAAIGGVELRSRVSLLVDF